MNDMRSSTRYSSSPNPSRNERPETDEVSVRERLQQGRFADAEKPNIKLLLQAMWDGFLLKCPSCSEGRIYDGWTKTHRSCPVCDAPFERYGEGDFVGAMVLAYSLAALFVSQIILVVNLVSSMPLWDQITLSAVAGLAFVLLLYRNMKGVWVAILLALLRWIG